MEKTGREVSPCLRRRAQPFIPHNIVPMRRVGMQPVTLRVILPYEDAERLLMGTHAERGTMETEICYH